MGMKPVYHIVSHSHWDREWYLSFEKFRSKLVLMVDDLLDLLRKDPKYQHFTLDGQSVILEDYLTVRPERKQIIRDFVEKGRISIGPWYILPDEFLVSGESTIRNLLHGIRIAREFGGEMKIGYIPDSFGHIAMMPAILKGFDFDAALVYRGFGGEPGQETSEYRWVAPDGTSCLLLHLFRHGYSAGYFHHDSDEEILERFSALKQELDARATTSHRLMMNGGDHHWPDPKLPRTIQLLRKNFEGTFLHSSIPAYIEEVKREVQSLPHVEGELRFGYSYNFAVVGGVYSSRIYLKQYNWKTQLLLERYVEPLNALASSCCGFSQLALIQQTWKNLLKNHPHDSICGCSIDSVHAEMMTRFKSVEDAGEEILSESVNKLIAYDDRESKDDHHIVFFNPSPFNRSEVAKAQIRFYLQDVVVGLNPDVTIEPALPPCAGFALIAADETEVPFQVIGRDKGYDITYSRYNYPKQTLADTLSILVKAADVPALGFSRIRIEKRVAFPKISSALKTGKTFIENAFLRVDVNAKGEIRIADKERKLQYKGLHIFEDSGDVGDEYNYSYPKKDKRVLSNTGKASAKIVEWGPLRVMIAIRMNLLLPQSASEDRQSRSRRTTRVQITSRIWLTEDSRKVEFSTTIENNAKDHRLRVLFPLGADTRSVYADSQFCLVERTQRTYDTQAFTIEHPAKVAPMQRFVSWKSGNKGVTLYSYGLPEYELLLDGKGTVALTLLRCVGLLSGGDLITRPGGRAGWHNETPDAQCLGEHTFRYALFPHAPSEIDTLEQIQRESEQFHLPLLPVSRKQRELGKIRNVGLAISPKTLVLSAFKEAEDGDGFIVRVYNPSKQEINGTIRFDLPVRDVFEAKLNEQCIEPVEVERERVVRIVAKPSEIVTLRLKLSQQQVLNK